MMEARKGGKHMIDYSPLWETLEKQGVSQYRLLQDKILDNKALDRIKKSENITMITLERICKYLNCTPNDVVRFLD